MKHANDLLQSDNETVELPEAQLPEGVKKIVTLPSGIIATIYKTKGRDVRQAQKIADGDPTLFTPAMMAIAIKMNGQNWFIDQFDDLDSDDFMQLMSEVSGNFTK